MGGHCPFFVLVAVKEGDTRVFEHLAILLAAMASHNAITRWLLPTGKPSLGGANIVLTGNRDAIYSEHLLQWYLPNQDLHSGHVFQSLLIV